MAIDTYSQYSAVEIHEDNESQELRRKRLIEADRALRPWLVGKALRDFRYTTWERIKLLFKETWEFAIWSWRTSK